MKKRGELVKPMIKYSDIAKMLLVAIHGANIFVIFLFTIDIPSAKRKLILVLYLLITNLIIHKILKKFGKVWFK